VAKRRKRGRIRRALGGLVFLGILGGAFWWILPLVRSTPQDAATAPTNLAGIAPSTQPPAPGSPLRPIESRPAASVASPPVPVSRPTVEAADLPRAQAAWQAGMRALEQNPVDARRLLSEALAKGLAGPDAEQARRMLNELGDRMIFSPVRTPGDPLVAVYTVKAGDTVGKIAAAHNISEELLAQINQLRNKNFVRLNQTLKVVHGPFHAVVDKSQHEMYITLGNVYVRDFRVALGMNGGTPTGKWVVANHLTNPSWVDPRTGKRWHADDPQNPIGEYWIGLQGIEGEAKGQIGFGIHGTIDEASIGQDVSMGCVRLAARDIEMVYKLLVPGKSTVVVKD